MSANTEREVLEADVELGKSPAPVMPGPSAWDRLFHRLRGRVAASVLVGLVACIVSFKLRTIPIVSDPWNYVLAGFTFPEMTWNMVGLTRYGIVLPMMLVTRLFDNSELTYYLMPLLATGVLLGSVYWLTARFFGSFAGLAASVLLLANSVVLVNASRLYPDIFAASATALAVVFAVASRDRWRADERVSRAVVVLLVLTGAAVGLSWYMRETAVFAWPIIALILLWKGGPPLRVTVLATGGSALLFLLLEMAISAWAFGDAFARFTALAGPDLSQTTNPLDMPYLGQSRLAYLEVVPESMILNADGWWMIAMAIVAYSGGLVFPRKVGLFAGWFVLVFFALVASGGGLRPDAPNIRLDVARYWLAFLPPMVIAAVGTMSTALRMAGAKTKAALPDVFRKRVWAALPVALAVVLVAGPVAASEEAVTANPAYVVTNHGVMSQFRNWLHAHDAQVGRIYTDYASWRQLPVYTRSFSGDRMAKAKFIAFGQGSKVRPGDYVVLFSAYGQTCGFCHSWITEWLAKNADRLDRWREVWRTPDRTFVVYRVPHRQPAMS